MSLFSDCAIGRFIVLDHEPGMSVTVSTDGYPTTLALILVGTWSFERLDDSKVFLIEVLDFELVGRLQLLRKNLHFSYVLQRPNFSLGGPRRQWTRPVYPLRPSRLRPRHGDLRRHLARRQRHSRLGQVLHPLCRSERQGSAVEGVLGAQG